MQVFFYTVNDRPEEKYINRHVRDQICSAGPAVWLDLGMELLQKAHVPALWKIKSNTSECSVSCSEMFKLWLEREPKASWSHLIEGLKRIHQNSLVCEIEKLLSVEQAREETDTIDQILKEDQLPFGQRLSEESRNGMCMCTVVGMGDTSTKILIPILYVLDTYRHQVLFLNFHSYTRVILVFACNMLDY